MNPAMLAALALAAAGQSPPPPETGLGDVGQAIDAGRLDQARMMIANAVKSGANGAVVERLLADLAFAAGDNAEALARYQRLAGPAPTDPAVCERAAIAALRVEAVEAAASMIDCATSGPSVTWRAWNARGVLADLSHDWPEADSAYRKAARLRPAEPSLLNNQGWSYLLRGQWSDARDCFQQAARLDPKSPRIANNLELSEAALSERLPGRRQGESDLSWAERLNDAGVAAELLGDKKRAIAAFTQALEASGSWYSLAGNNLDAASNAP